MKLMTIYYKSGKILTQYGTIKKIDKKDVVGKFPN